MEKRVILAIALSFLTIGIYQMALNHFYPEAARPVSVSAPEQTAAQTVSSPSVAVPVSSPSEELLPAGNVSFETSELSAFFNRSQGGLSQISFKRFPKSETGKALTVLDEKTSQALPTSLQLVGSAKPLLYDIRTQNGRVEMSAANDGLNILKSYSFDGYHGTLTVVFENKGSAEKNFQYQLFAGPTLIPREAIDAQYLEANFYPKASDKKAVRHIRETGKGKSVRSDNSMEWIAVKDRHFSVILKPEGGNFAGLVEGLGDHRSKTSLVSDAVSLAPGGRVEQRFAFYIGPNEIERLEPLGLGPLVNFGKMDAIGKLLVGALELLHKITRNYGIAIILLTVLINILFFPLTRVSYMSMKRMQQIQPLMNKLRDQHKNNPEKLNKEMMELYKKHKVNPFAGCVPLLLQMPVFIALYVALSKCVFLINSKFLWATDLSSPDAVHLPFSLPVLGNEIHILPLIMVAGMVIQQKFTQVKMEGQDPALAAQQRMMAVMMPILFGFIFYGMPAGLVLYWLTNTVLMTSYQLYLKRVTLT